MQRDDCDDQAQKEAGGWNALRSNLWVKECRALKICSKGPTLETLKCWICGGDHSQANMNQLPSISGSALAAAP